MLTGSAEWCGICGCRMKRRTKHCFRCGRCVRKFDHHCPWIGGCVGEKNHCGFVVLLVTHSLQAVWAMVVCIRSLQLFEYKFKDGSFSQEYGVFAVFALFMGLYLCFAGGVLIFQLYLVTTNTTTREVLDRKKCAYLRGLTYNPFTRGLLGNIAQTACPNPDGE